MLTINGWKFLTKSEVSEVMGSTVKVYDGHFDNVFDYEAVTCEVDGHMYLAAYDHHCNKIFPVIENNGRLEVLNSITIGYVDGTKLEICKVFEESQNAKLHWRNQSTLTGDEFDNIESGIIQALASGDYDVVKMSR